MDHHEIAKIHQLVQSADEKNIAVAFEIFQSADYKDNQELVTYLFTLAFFHPKEEIRQQAKPLLKKVVSASFYVDSARDLVFSKIVPKSGIPSVFIFTHLLEQIHKKGVLDVQTLGKYTLDLWTQSWEFCWKHQTEDITYILNKIKKGTSLQLAGSVRDLPEALWQLTDLESLTIINRNLSRISDDIRNLTNLRYLNIQSKLSAFPVGLVELVGLEELKLFISNDQFFNSVPPEVDQLLKLKSLTFTSLAGEFPINFCFIVSLESIDLGYSNFTDFPEEIAQLANLQSVKLNFNENLNLKGVFRKLSKISSLKNLDLSFCKLDQLPEEIALLDQVENLNLSGCHLLDIPMHIEDMVSLKSIDISHNQLSSIPPTLYRLPRLEKIRDNSGIIEVKAGNK
ncbi:MAG TPA: hypothetical protein DCS93_17485 [Microscillaceae bacterium]|nr:hypothetical protein [Microscillaceae bacterium]